MDRTEAAPLTSERRYGIYRTGLVAAALLIVVVAGAGIALLFGIRNATILLCILLPLLLLSAAIAHLFLWWQHRRAVHRRENAVGEWVPATVHRQQQSIPSADSPRSSDSWFKRISSRASTRSTPPPGYHTVSTS
ncbi:uncharacterized protein LOC105703278 isoform X1 [Orussus abietinus]|uniref:uncharacterized protein LOC105703278 isoform X1 n=1 Tax=Orussus abietinus TaxID=222816 RepID=UPI000625137F|nr:uncharacterized protein LOC105703278 isoform X1 [Orussus abietinus]